MNHYKCFLLFLVSPFSLFYFWILFSPSSLPLSLFLRLSFFLSRSPPPLIVWWRRRWWSLFCGGGPRFAVWHLLSHNDPHFLSLSDLMGICCVWWWWWVFAKFFFWFFFWVFKDLGSVVVDLLHKETREWERREGGERKWINKWIVLVLIWWIRIEMLGEL